MDIDIEEQAIEVIANHLAEATAMMERTGFRRDLIIRGYERHIENLRAEMERGRQH